MSCFAYNCNCHTARILDINLSDKQICLETMTFLHTIQPCNLTELSNALLSDQNTT